MLKLNENRKLQAVLAAAITTTAPVAAVGYNDKDASAYDGDTQLATLAGAAATDICAAPAADAVRHIDYITVRNWDSVQHTVTLRTNQAGTTVAIFEATLDPGELLGFTHGNGWYVCTADGSRKSGAVQDLSGYALTTSVSSSIAVLSGSTSTGISSLSTSTSTAVSSLSTSTSSAAASLSTATSTLSSSVVVLSSSTSSGISSLSTSTSTAISSLSTSTSTGLSSLSTSTSSNVVSLSTATSTLSSSVTVLSTSTSTGISSLSTSTSTAISSLSTSTSTGLSTVTSTATALSTSTSSAISSLSTSTSSAIAAGSGTTINATNGVFPYRSSGTAFADSPLVRVDANTVSQENSTTAQVSYQYKTKTDPSNYERFTISFSGSYAVLGMQSAGTGSANLGIVLNPIGTGAITVQLPDSTATGGNARGSNSTDTQMVRSNASEVASGTNSAVISGRRNTASGAQSAVVGGFIGVASGQGAFVGGGGETGGSVGGTASGNQSATLGGYQNTASGNQAAVIGGSTTTCSGRSAFSGGAEGSTASGTVSSVFGGAAKADKRCQMTHGYREFVAAGDAQSSRLGVRGTTTDATPTELFNSDVASERITIAAKTAWHFTVRITALTSSAGSYAVFTRQGMLVRDNSNNTTLIGTNDTIGTDKGSNAGSPPAGWAVSITADDTNEALKVTVTGAAATTIRWLAVIDLVEVTF